MKQFTLGCLGLLAVALVIRILTWVIPVALVLVGLASIAFGLLDGKGRRGYAVLGVVGVVAGVAMASNLGLGPTKPSPAASSVAPAAASSPTRRTATPSATPTPSDIEVFDVRGMNLPDAEQKLRSVGLRITHEDLTPRDRSVHEPKNWTVAAMSHTPGTRLVPKTKVTLYLLKTPEYEWFMANPTMPELTLNTATNDLCRYRNATDKAGPLDPIQELLEYRWMKGTDPSRGHPDTKTVSKRKGPPAEPQQEIDDRTQLQVSSGYNIAVAARPGAGESVRMGRLIVIIEKPRPEEPASSSELDVDVSVSHSDDNDVNIPGWLCPTRFC